MTFFCSHLKFVIILYKSKSYNKGWSSTFIKMFIFLCLPSANAVYPAIFGIMKTTLEIIINSTVSLYLAYLFVHSQHPTRRFRPNQTHCHYIPISESSLFVLFLKSGLKVEFKVLFLLEMLQRFNIIYNWFISFKLYYNAFFKTFLL